MIRDERCAMRRMKLAMMSMFVLAGSAAGCADGYIHRYDDGGADRGDQKSMAPESEESSEQATESSELAPFAREVKRRVESYRDGGFEKVTEPAFPSAVAGGKEIGVWVSEEGVSDYLSATDSESGDPDVPALPEESIIVREIRNDAGDVEKLTVVAQRERSFHEEVGGLWFGVMSPDFEYKETSDGSAQAGSLASCASCHRNKRSTGYLYGVPNDYLAVDRVGSGTSGMGDGDMDDSGSASDPSATDGAAGDEMSPPTPTYDISGLTLVNRETLGRVQSSPIRGSGKLEPGDQVVIARRATKTEFEHHWGVTLGDEVIYIDQEQESPFGAPIVNGDESWAVVDGNDHVLAGPTPIGGTDRSYERVNFTGEVENDWTSRPAGRATPGTNPITADTMGRRPGLFVSEWSDGAGDYRMEFVELTWIPGR